MIIQTFTTLYVAPSPPPKHHLCLQTMPFTVCVCACMHVCVCPLDKWLMGELTQGAGVRDRWGVTQRRWDRQCKGTALCDHCRVTQNFQGVL